MHGVACTGAGFLLAVLWFDLMFDTQIRHERDPIIPDEIRDSIAHYYRRVTTTARPMNRLVAGAMLVTVAALIGEIVAADVRQWSAIASLLLTGTAVAVAAARTVRTAVRLGNQAETAEVQSTMARTIYRDHLMCLAAVGTTVILQTIFA